MSILTKIFGDPNAKVLKTLQPIVDKINALEPEYEKLPDAALKGKTAEFKNRLEKGESLDDILSEAFAVVREASKRTTGMRHYDVQLIGGMVLHSGKIAEMRTGEGKTLVATLPIYLNALSGRGAHLITVNDYLAKRDAVWMGQIYVFLGLSVGIVQNQRVSYLYDSSFTESLPGAAEGGDAGSYRVESEFLRAVSRQEAYRADITYGTNNEFGFDYLRDNMVQDLSEMVMRPGAEMSFGIVDEVDSILIDEARTPLIISAPAERAAEEYYQFAKLVRNLGENEDYNVDEKLRAATLTEAGITKFERWLGIENIYVEGGMRIIHHIEQALKAAVLFKRDKEYVVDGGEIVIIDEFTGRKMPGRRYSEGLHQAIEAKEGVPIQRESQTLATVTFQNLFRMYQKLAGMTGTAITEAEEFASIYNLEVVSIPTNRPDRRIDHPDRIYKLERGKYYAIVEKIKECQAKGQPILVGTISVEKNEQLAGYLDAQGIKYEALNAKNHEREGEIIAQAGRSGAVTLATNMAGRGVDIKLGGAEASPEEAQRVKAAGGLFVLGTERHESRRIDNQLRGRSARQGDHGETHFFVSTEDDLMRIFAGERLRAVMTRLNLPEDMPIEQKMITKMIETAQKKVEGHNFDIRKHLLEYDDVLNKQRTIIYKRRREILAAAALADRAALKNMILSAVEQELEFVVSFHTNPEEKDDWNLKEIYETAQTIFEFTEGEKTEFLAIDKKLASKEDEVKTREKIVDWLLAKAKIEYDKMAASVGQSVADTEQAAGLMASIEKNIMLRAIDSLWVEYLVSIDHLRAGIGLRGYGQRDPLIEYKKETYQMFNELQVNIQKEVVYSFYKVSAGLQLAPSVMAADKLTLSGAKKNMGGEGGAGKPRNEAGEKVGRNDLCPCGSGKKYKKCHGV